MLEALKGAIEGLLGGHGPYSVTVPVLDGPLKPNNRLELAPRLVEVADVDNLVATDDGLLASSGQKIILVSDTGKVSEVLECEAPVTALARAADGKIAFGLEGVGVALRHGGSMRVIRTVANHRLDCVTALDWGEGGWLAIVNGSNEVPTRGWRRDLMSGGHSGFVAIANERGEGRIVADRMAFPSGICVAGSKAYVSEAWRHRVVQVDLSVPKAPTPLLQHLPGYPARISRLAGGRFALCFYSVRSQLIEFVLRETRYRQRMLAEVPEEFWVAPALSSGHSFKEPLQAGGVIRLGIHKPWAPARSYGLVCVLDTNFQPVASAHSRAGGRRHGVLSVAESNGRLFAAAKGSGEIVVMDGALRDLDIEPEAA